MIDNKLPFPIPIPPHVMWDKDADFNVPVISLVGCGPKGEKGDPASTKDIADSVDRWIAKHPEMIANVLDGSITLEKLAEDVIVAMTNEIAEERAAEAIESAEQAKKAADTSLYQLSVIEDIIGTIEWLQNHTTYAISDDSTVIDGKKYYQLIDGAYVPIELSEWTYSQTQDAEPQDDKTYYVVDNDGNYIVAGVDSFDSGTTYYERSVTNPSELEVYEANVADYISSHLSMTDDGLIVSADEGDYRMIMKTSGWEILDSDGQPVNAVITDSQGHVINTIGRTDKLHLEISDSRLSFKFPNGNTMTEVAWIEVDQSTGVSSFHISNAVVMRELRIGSWKWYEDVSGDLVLKWIGE